MASMVILQHAAEVLQSITSQVSKLVAPSKKHAHDYLVYLGLVYLFAQASSTSLPRPGLPAFNTHASSKRGARAGGRTGGDIFENMDVVWISSFMGSPGLGTITIRSALKS